MANTDPNIPSKQDQWLRDLGVPQKLLASTTPAAPAHAALSAPVAPSGNVAAPGVSLISVVIARPLPFEQGGQQQLSAKGFYSDNSLKNITGKVKWSSSDEHLLKIAPGGLAKVAHGAGDVTITAEMPRDDGHPGKRAGSLMVKLRYPLLKIIVTPQNPMLALGSSTDVMTATAVYTDKSTENITDSVEWTSSNEKVAKFLKFGFFDIGEAGTSDLKATDEATGFSGFTKLIVPPTGRAPVLKKVTISPLNPEIKTGQPVQFTAMGEFSDKSTHEITRSVKWESSDPKVLAIDPTGLATPSLRSGQPLIRGSDNTTGHFQSTTVYVEMPGVKSLKLTARSTSVVSGEYVVVTAMAVLAGGARMQINHAVDWTISNPDAATMTLKGEQVRGLAPDDITIQAYEPFSEQSDMVGLKILPPVLRSIVIKPEVEKIPVNKTVQLAAEGTLSDGTPAPPLKKLHWGTSKPNVIDITQTGQATAKAPGKSAITATDLPTGEFGGLTVEAVP